MGEISALPVEYDYDARGNIVLPDGAPFDGSQVLIKLTAGWCEARWETGSKCETMNGTEYEGFEWVCMDGDFTAELDDAKFWTPLPIHPPIVCEECGANPADHPSRLCVGCNAYREHTGAL